MKASLNNLLLELHVPNFEIAKDFYGKLGFKVTWERPPEEKKGYLVLKRGNTILCFWPGNEFVTEQDYFKQFPKETKKGFGVEIVIMVEDIDKFYANAKQVAHVVEIMELRPWGLKDFRIEDPFGFYIRFTEPHDILDEINAVK